MVCEILGGERWRTFQSVVQLGDVSPFSPAHHASLKWTVWIQIRIYSRPCSMHLSLFLLYINHGFI